MRALIIAMFLATISGGALLLGTALPGASAAGFAAQRTCSQSVTTNGRPGGLSLTYTIYPRTDTCGRWLRSEERCQFPGTPGFTYKWKAGKSVRVLGRSNVSKSVAVCGVLASKVTNWGFGTYIRGRGWVFKQEGHS